MRVLPATPQACPALRPASRAARAAGVVLASCVWCCVSCAHPAIVTTDVLPVQRVIVYRNGVAYFERAGHVDQDVIRFKMKQAEVGDFLATLAVMERGGSSVRSAAFPLKVDDETEEDAAPPRTDDEKKGLEVVSLELDGRAHDLRVGYVAESPVWRPSYRLVVRPGGQADLQAWGIVENLSGEDWTAVKLSLVAGAPLTFRAELGVPVIPPRPTVTDEGEVISAVPQGETSLAQEAAPEASKKSRAQADEEEAEEPPGAAAALGHGAGTGSGQGFGNGHGRLGGGPRGSASAPAPSPARPQMMPMAPPPPPAAISAPRNLRSLAAVAVEAGVTRYDLPLPVTVPDRSATMVMLLSRQVSGEAMFLFAPDPGVPDSSSHPFRVARFTNGTDGVIERGPIAVFEQDAFLGQGMVDPLPAGATATVPFALERAVAVDVDRKFDEQGARLFRIQNAQLWIQRDRVTLTKYRVRNGGDTPAKILVKHGRVTGSSLHDPPAGTEDNVGTGSALLPTTVAPHATAELTVDERSVETQGQDWYGPIADKAVTDYLADPKADRAMVGKITALWTIRGDVVRARQDRDRLQRQASDLSQSTEETRRNLRAIEKNKTAEALRQKLTARLADAAARLDDLNRKLVEVDSKLAELGVRFSEALREIDLSI